MMTPRQRDGRLKLRRAAKLTSQLPEKQIPHHRPPKTGGRVRNDSVVAGFELV
jgi:hypothetical protein